MKRNKLSIEVERLLFFSFLSMFSPPLLNSLAVFGSLEGERMRGFERKEGRSEKNGELWEAMTLRTLVFFIIQNSSNLGELKNYIGEGFWRT